jgi:YbbR domain-containing protein
MRRIFADPLAKIASVVVALLAWLYVQSDQVLDIRLSVPVTWELPDARMPTVPLPDTAVLTLRGTHAATRRAAEAGARIDVDLTALPLGEHRMDLGTVPTTGLSPGVEVVGVNPADLRFTLDEAVTRKVKVDPAQVGDPAPGFLIDGVTVEPPVVVLRGPRSAMANLRSVGIQPLDVTGLRADASFPVDLDLPIGVAVADGEMVPTALVQVRPAIERLRFPAVPVYVWDHPDWRSSTATVEVMLEGSASTLEDLKAEDVVAFVHLPEPPTAGGYEAPWGPGEGARLRILHPGGNDVKVVRVTPGRVRAVHP